MVEGYARIVPKPRRALITNLENANGRGLKIPEHSLRWDPQRGDMLRAQKVGPRRIFSGSFDAVVRKTIDFDRQPHRRAVEIENIDTCGMLSAELESGGSFAQFAPQQCLRQ